MRAKSTPSLSGRGLYFEDFIEKVYLFLQIVQFEEEVTVLLIVKALMEGSHVLVFLLLFHLEQLGEVGVIRVALKISCIRTANCGSHGLRVS